MVSMAKRKNQPQNRTPAFVVYARIDEQLGKVLESHVNGIKPKTSLTAVVELAIEQYLERLGLWPIHQDDAD